jgi:hypothetical protein
MVPSICLGISFPGLYRYDRVSGIPYPVSMTTLLPLSPCVSSLLCSQTYPSRQQSKDEPERTSWLDIRLRENSRRLQDDYPSPVLYVRQSDWKQMGDLSESIAGRFLGRVRKMNRRLCILLHLVRLMMSLLLVARRTPKAASCPRDSVPHNKRYTSLRGPVCSSGQTYASIFPYGADS